MQLQNILQPLQSTNNTKEIKYFELNVNKTV